MLQTIPFTGPIYTMHVTENSQHLIVGMSREAWQLDTLNRCHPSFMFSFFFSPFFFPFGVCWHDSWSPGAILFFFDIAPRCLFYFF